MARNCDSHPFEVASGTCATCRRDFCPTCLVYADGEDAEPYCIPCALAAAGVRRGAARPRLRGRREPLPTPSDPGGSPVGRAAVTVALVTGTGVVAAGIVAAIT